VPRGHAPQPRISSSQHTLDHDNCPACEASRDAAENGATLKSLTFIEAGSLWLESRKRISDRTRHDYQQYIHALSFFFGKLTLSQIHIGHINEYQRARVAGEIPGLKRAAATRTNHELGVMEQILKRAGLWKGKIGDWYEPLPMPKEGPGFAMEEVEERHLFATAATEPRWLVAYCCSLITANTTAGPGEIRNLRLCDVDLPAANIRIVEGAKNGYRVRDLPLNDAAFWAVTQLLERAEDKGAYLPTHYLLPHRAHTRKSKPDPTRPMGSWKKAWGSLRREAGKRYPRLSGLRMYDLRHQIITKLLENPDVSEKTVEALAGHISDRMKDRYSHIRTQAKRAAVDAIRMAPQKVGPQLVTMPQKA
jgi:integrase